MVISVHTVVWFSCVFQVFYYSASVFEGSGIPDDKIQYAVLGTGIINVIMTGVSVSSVLCLSFNTVILWTSVVEHYVERYVHFVLEGNIWLLLSQIYTPH